MPSHGLLSHNTDRDKSRHAARRGITLIDLIAVTAILAIMALLVAPPIRKMHDGLELRLAAEEVAGAMRQARQHAIVHNTHVGIKFETDDDTGFVTMSLYRDGDGDGVKSRDIAKGIDPPESAAQPLTHVGAKVRFGFPTGAMPRNINGRGVIPRRQDPIRFNRSDIASFGPLGTATPGTVYLTDGSHRVAAVRISSHHGRMRIYYWSRMTGAWR